jgi:hypothetical protein
MAGGSAGGDGRRSVERRSRKVIRRRKPQVDWKVGPEGRSPAQVGDESEGLPEGWSPTQVGDRLEGKPEDWSVAQAADRPDGWPLDLIPIFSRRLSWKATLEGWQTAQVGNRRKLVAYESRRLIGKRGRRVGSRRKSQVGPSVAGRRNTRLELRVLHDETPETRRDLWRFRLTPANLYFTGPMR